MSLRASALLPLLSTAAFSPALAFTPSPELAGCDEVVIGAGWAGVYFAYRRAVASAQPSRICLFEASERIGGRTFSVRNVSDTFVLDVGAYRFSPDMHLPGDLILHHLQLPTACYEPGCPSAKQDMPEPFVFNYSAPLRRVVDPETGIPAGYVTPIERMAAAMMAMGVKIHMMTPLVDLAMGKEGTPTLTFDHLDTELSVQPKLVMLNMARNRLFELRSIRSELASRTVSMLECIKFDQPAHMFRNWSHLESDEPTALSKAYFEYKDAWWVTRLNQSEGEFPANAFFPIHTDLGIPIGIRWSDGPIACGGRAPATLKSAPQACSGFLERGIGVLTIQEGTIADEAVYYAVTNESFYRGISLTSRTPLGVLRGEDEEGRAKLKLGHDALMEAIGSILTRKGAEPASIAPPEQIVVGVWRRPDKTYPLGPPGGLTAPTKVYYSPAVSGSLAQACRIAGLTEDEYRSTAMQPFGKEHPIFMANNDWVAMDVQYIFGDWAEETLLQSERALRTLGMDKPSWLNATYYADKIMPFATPAF